MSTSLWRVSAVLRAIRRLPPTALASCSTHEGLAPPMPGPRPWESLEVKRARLLYQSRKRGTLENGILLSGFASTHLPGLSSAHLEQYDYIINQLDDDWKLYYWMTGAETPPPERDTEVLRMLQSYTQTRGLHRQGNQPDITRSDVYIKQQ